MANEGHELVGDEMKGSNRSRRLIVWSALAFVALLIYELTARPAFGIVILCTKFGWDNFLTAYWLRRIDPNRARARTCFWFLIASGVFRAMSAASGLCVILFVFQVLGIQNRAAPFPPEILVAFRIFVVGSFISVLAIYFGFWNAFRSGLRIWLASPVVSDKEFQKRNWTEHVLILALLPLGLVAGFYIFPVMAMVLDPQEKWLGLFISLWIIWMVGIAFLLFKLFFALKRRLLAEQPGECWEPDLLGELMVSQMPNWKRWRRLAAIPRGSN
jgi:hypothetical protein